RRTANGQKQALCREAMTTQHLTEKAVNAVRPARNAAKLADDGDKMALFVIGRSGNPAAASLPLPQPSLRLVTSTPPATIRPAAQGRDRNGCARIRNMRERGGWRPG